MTNMRLIQLANLYSHIFLHNSTKQITFNGSVVYLDIQINTNPIIRQQ